METNDFTYMNYIQNRDLEQEARNNNNNIIQRCLNCGEYLQPSQDFCHSCGMKVGNEISIFCSNCGTAIGVEQRFCPECGSKIKTKNKKRLIIIISISTIALIMFFIIGMMVLPKIFISTEDLLAQGNYESAYKKANDIEKAEILKENLIANLCNEIIDAYKDPDSFELRDAWFDEEAKSVVIRASGKNSFGGVVSAYSYFIYNEEEEKFKFLCNLSSLEKEEYSEYDTAEELAEKIVYNAARTVVSGIIEKGECKIRKSSIKNINNLFKEGILENIELMNFNEEETETT